MSASLTFPQVIASGVSAGLASVMFRAWLVCEIYQAEPWRSRHLVETIAAGIPQACAIGAVIGILVARWTGLSHREIPDWARRLIWPAAGATLAGSIAAIVAGRRVLAPVVNVDWGWCGTTLVTAHATAHWMVSTAILIGALLGLLVPWLARQKR